MKHRRLAYLAAGILITLGIVLTAMRLQARGREQRTRPDTMWSLAYNIDFTAAVEGADLRVSLPQETAAVDIFRESFFWKNLGVGGTRSTNGSRTFSGYAERPGRYRFRVLFDLHLDPTFAPDPDEEAPTQDKPGKFVGAHKLIPSGAPEIVRTVRGLLSGTVDRRQRVDRILAHLRGFTVEPSGADDPRIIVTRRQASERGLARTFTTLCRAADIPSRTVSGFQLRSTRAAPVRHWNEVHLGGRWVAVDPLGQFKDQVPPDLLPVLLGAGDFVQTSEPSVAVARFALSQRPLPAMLLGDYQRRWTDVVDLDRLPLEIQDVLVLLLLLPFGALITAVFRNLVGLETFGTFSPVLIALSFKFADWTTGLLALALVLVFGLGFRRVLERLKLLMVPRLGILLTLVVMVLIFSVSVGDHLGWTPGPDAVFLPVVILAGMIERLFITFEEDGARHCLRMGLGTALVAACCWLVFDSEAASLWILTHPELHLVTVGALILTGRYVGYRLTELWRFRDLVRAIARR